MTSPKVKGWCPGALRPMMSGDGLVVRVRPMLGRLTVKQTEGLAELAIRYGNKSLELSNRANVQLRGIQETDHPVLVKGLRGLGLVDNTEAQERRRNVMIQPFWQTDDETHRLAKTLTEALLTADLDLPAKFGFAIDTGPRPLLQNASADIRLERKDNQLLIIADGGGSKAVTSNTAIPEVLALSEWFAGTRGEHKRMQRLLASGHPLPEGFHLTDFAAPPSSSASSILKPQRTPAGHLIGVAFGRISAETFAQLGTIRLTPWRMLVIEGPTPNADELITDPTDPRLRIVSCTGASGCAQAQGDTRNLAARLAARLPDDAFLHVTGCTKNCAHPGHAPLTVTATPDGYDLARDGETTHTGLTPTEIEKAL